MIGYSPSFSAVLFESLTGNTVCKNLRMTTAEVIPFKISIPDSEVEDLKQRLAHAKLPMNELKDADWDYGTPLSEVKKISEYWANEFDWRAAEAKLNELPQYTTVIQCECYEPLTIHFVHQKSKSSNAIPLLFVHGCKIVPFLPNR